MTLSVIIAYLVIVVALGTVSKRLSKGTGEDYFVATRTIGPVILLMSLFGTHMTAFSLLGASGEAYHRGVGVFALMASSSALVVPLVFFFIGTRAWWVGKQHNFLTQVQFFRARWGSDSLGLVIFAALVLLVIPYLIIGVLGGGITLNQITDGQVPQWIGSMIVCLVVMSYVTFGGLRGTAWVNTLQTLVFMVLGALTFVVIVKKLGGLQNALTIVAEKNTSLLVRGDAITPVELISYTFIPLSVGMFPHIFMHWLSARRAETFKPAIVLYPVCIAVVWVPSVLLGILATIDFPGLQGPAANSVLVQLIDLHAPEILSGLLAAGVFAAIMSSLDSQVLSLSTMFTQDIVRHYGFGNKLTDKQQILFGRLFVGVILLLIFLLSLTDNRSIFRLGIWSFTGFTALLPVLIAALYWKKSTKYGGFAGVLSTILLWSFFFSQGMTTIGGGLKPVVVMFLASGIAVYIGSVLTPQAVPADRESFFPPTNASALRMEERG